MTITAFFDEEMEISVPLWVRSSPPSLGLQCSECALHTEGLTRVGRSVVVTVVHLWNDFFLFFIDVRLESRKQMSKGLERTESFDIRKEQRLRSSA